MSSALARRISESRLGGIGPFNGMIGFHVAPPGRLISRVLLSDMVDNSDLPFARELYPFSDGFSTGDIPMPGHTTDTRPSQAPMSARWPPISHAQAAPIG